MDELTKLKDHNSDLDSKNKVFTNENENLKVSSLELNKICEDKETIINE